MNIDKLVENIKDTLIEDVESDFRKYYTKKKSVKIVPHNILPPEVKSKVEPNSIVLVFENDKASFNYFQHINFVVITDGKYASRAKRNYGKWYDWQTWKTLDELYKDMKGKHAKYEITKKELIDAVTPKGMVPKTIAGEKVIVSESTAKNAPKFIHQYGRIKKVDGKLAFVVGDMASHTRENGKYQSDLRKDTGFDKAIRKAKKLGFKITSETFNDNTNFRDKLFEPYEKEEKGIPSGRLRAAAWTEVEKRIEKNRYEDRVEMTNDAGDKLILTIRDSVGES